MTTPVYTVLPATPVALTGTKEHTDKCSYIWYAWFLQLSNLFKSGYTGTIITASITGPGVNGSMTFTNGVLTKQVAAT